MGRGQALCRRRDARYRRSSDTERLRARAVGLLRAALSQRPRTVGARTRASDAAVRAPRTLLELRRLAATRKAPGPPTALLFLRRQARWCAAPFYRPPSSPALTGSPSCKERVGL